MHTCKPRTNQTRNTSNEIKEMEQKEDLRLTLSLTTLDINSSYASIDHLSKDHNIYQTSLERSGSRTILQGSDEEEGGGRKKLRLSKQQSSTLEDAFRQHHTLNPREKMALANELGLRPRQVEVWFQNRRARKKLKKTEVDCEMLKRCCESLSEENRRLQKELLELRALKRPQHHQCMQMGRARDGNATTPPTTLLSICPACERAAAGAEYVGIFRGPLASHRRQISPLS